MRCSISQETRDEARAFFVGLYNHGYQEGRRGVEYTGKSYIGLHGWYRGMNDRKESLS